VLAGPRERLLRTRGAPHVDGTQIIYFGHEAGLPTKVKNIWRGASPALHPLRRETVGMVAWQEAMDCGLRWAALERRALVSEVGLVRLVKA